MKKSEKQRSPIAVKLRYLLDKEGITVTKFSEDKQKKRQAIYKLLNSTNKEMTYESIEMILDYFGLPNFFDLITWPLYSETISPEGALYYNTAENLDDKRAALLLVFHPEFQPTPAGAIKEIEHCVETTITPEGNFRRVVRVVLQAKKDQLNSYRRPFIFNEDEMEGFRKHGISLLLKLKTPKAVVRDSSPKKIVRLTTDVRPLSDGERGVSDSIFVRSVNFDPPLLYDESICYEYEVTEPGAVPLNRSSLGSTPVRLHRHYTIRHNIGKLEDRLIFPPHYPVYNEGLSVYSQGDALREVEKKLIEEGAVRLDYVEDHWELFMELDRPLVGAQYCLEWNPPSRQELDEFALPQEKA